MKAQLERHHHIKRIVNISDTHLGVRNNNLEWLEIQESYFYDWLIPLLKKNYKPGDALIHNGDVFDSRQSLNLRVLNMGLDIFSKISEFMPVYIICGNHDIYYKKSNDVNSLKPLSFIKDINVYENPILLEFNKGKTTAFLMPWQDDISVARQLIAENPADYMFCHSDVNGLKFNSVTTLDSGLELNNFSKYRRVYTGHIHYAQLVGNIRCVGSAYPLTRSDIGNTKNVWYIDLETHEETSIQNSHSPIFMKTELSSILELPYGKLCELFKNNFVDIYSRSDMSHSFPFSEYLDAFRDVGARKLNYIINFDTPENSQMYDDGESQFNLYQLIEEYIDNLSYKENTKNKLKQYSQKLYNKFSNL